MTRTTPFVAHTFDEPSNGVATFTAVGTASRLASLAVPIDLPTLGLPVSVQLIGRHEHDLLQIAQAITSPSAL